MSSYLIYIIHQNREYPMFQVPTIISCILGQFEKPPSKSINSSSILKSFYIQKFTQKTRLVHLCSQVHIL